MSQQQTVLRVQTNIPHPTITGQTEHTFLDLYSDIPIRINKSFSELQDIAKKNSDYSIGLSLPGSKRNNQFFESFFNVDSVSLYFNATKRVECQVLLNDQSYFRGYMRLNKVSVINSKVEYDITLYSSVGDLFGKIGNNLLKDLDFDDTEYTFNHTFGVTSVGDRLAASNFFRDSKYPYTYFYPIVHNGYNYVNVSGATLPDFTGSTVSLWTRLYTPTTPITGATSYTGLTSLGVQEYRINSPRHGLVNNQLKPAINVYSLIQLMFKEYGYEITSEFFNTPWFKSLYLYGYFSSDSTKFGYRLDAIQQLPKEGVELIYSGSTVPNSPLNIIVCKRGTGIPCYCLDDINYGFANMFPYSEFGTIYSLTSGTTLTAVEGFDFGFEVDGVPVADISTLKYAPAAVGSSVAFFDGDTVNFSLVIDQNIKQIDLLSSIAKKFDLVFIPDPDYPNRIKIEPYDFYVGTGTVYDWTPKMSWDKGFTVEPALNYIESTLELTDLEDGDEGNREFKISNNRVYGRNIVYNPTDFKSQEKKIDTIFSPELIRQWDTLGPNGSSVIGLPLGINYSASSEISSYDNQVRWIYRGVKSKPKLFFWGMGLNPFIDSVGEVYPLRSENTYTIKLGNFSGGTMISYNRIPSVSHTMPYGLADEFKINNDSLSILFNSEQQVQNSVPLYNTYTENDCYNIFYNNRITNLYDPNTRFISGYFDLKYPDIQNLKWNDIIKINEQYFTINKISEFNLTNRELTKVELIQTNVKPRKYPNRYFRYSYCEDTSACYVISTDFTNENLFDTNFIWSLYYDNQVGSLTGQTSGFTATFFIFNFDTFQAEYLPYSMEEITEEEYNNTECSNWTLDPNMELILSQNGGLQASLVSFWDTSNYVNGYTGVNVWNNCADFYATAAAYGINIKGLIPATLADGLYIGWASRAYNTGIGGVQYPPQYWFSSNAGQTFTRTNVGKGVTSQNITLDGSGIYATNDNLFYDTAINYSNNSGTSWNDITYTTSSIQVPRFLVNSSSGNTMHLMVGQTLSDYFITQTFNTGTTWTPLSGSFIDNVSGYTTGYTFISCGSTGYPLLAGKGPIDRPRPPDDSKIVDNLYRQSSSGSTFTKITNSPAQEYLFAKSSDNGNIIVAAYVDYFGEIPAYQDFYYTYIKSLNGGSSWSTITSWQVGVGSWGMDMSADGKYIYLLKYEISPYFPNYTQIYKSSDYGATFQILNGPIIEGANILPGALRCSQNGKTVIMQGLSTTVGNRRYMIISNNYGVSWYYHTFNGTDNILDNNGINR